MDWVKIFYAAIFPACLFLACSNNSANASKGNSNDTLRKMEASSNSTTSGGDASFSCKIDGKDFSGKGTDQFVNAASVHAPGIIYFSLASNFSGDPGADMRAGGLGFEVPDKGTTTIRDVENSDYSIAYNPPNQPTNTYKCKEMTITINSSGGRVKGTFSGTLIEPKTGRDVPVTDGKFDIPYSSLTKK
jgi:hypothetical protein